MSSRALLERIRRTPRPSLPTLVSSKFFSCILPIAQIAIGAVYLHDCPRQHYIPIYLIVLGVFSLVLAVLSCLPGTQETNNDNTDNTTTTTTTTNPLSTVCMTWNSIITFFLFCWFIAGNVWIYSIYQPNYNKNSTTGDPYCNKTLYLFAFWTTTLVYIIIGLFLIVGFLVLCCFCLCGRADPDDDI